MTDPKRYDELTDTWIELMDWRTDGQPLHSGEHIRFAMSEQVRTFPATESHPTSTTHRDYVTVSVHNGVLKIDGSGSLFVTPKASNLIEIRLGLSERE